MSTTGLVLGKFMPPTFGHKYLIEFAHGMVDQLFVVLGSLSKEPIDGWKRFQWLTEHFKDTNIIFIHQTDELPQEPEEHPDFWNLWRRNLQVVTGRKQFDYVFASELYGVRLSEEMGAKFVPADIGRAQVQISATMVRSDPARYWDYLLPPVQRALQKVVTIIGPESCGKTTLARDLATHFNTKWVPEYARTYLEATNQGMNFTFDEMDIFARGQIASLQATRKTAKEFVFVDTDPFITSIYSEAYFHKVSENVVNAMYEWDSYNDLYIVLKPNVPWVPDVLRDDPFPREEFFEQIMDVMKNDHPHIIVDANNWQGRTQQALDGVNNFFKNSAPASWKRN